MKDAETNRNRAFSPDWKALRGLWSIDLNVPKATLRLFSCFLQKTFALLFQWDRVQSIYNKKHPIRYEGGRYRMLRQSAILALIQASNNCILNLYSEENK